MITITQKEYFALREKFKDLSVKVCSKRKRGANSKTYYCEERPVVLREVNKMREAEIVGQ